MHASRRTRAVAMVNHARRLRDFGRYRNEMIESRTAESTPNSYESSPVTDRVSECIPRGKHRFLRVIIYTHLTAIVFTAFAVAQDSRSMIWSDEWEPLLETMLAIGILAMVIGPIAMLICVARSSLTTPWRLGAIATEALLTGTHFLALLPAVQ